MPGGVRTRSERHFPGAETPEQMIDLHRKVPITLEIKSLIDIYRYGRRLRELGYKSVVLVGCDPLIYLEAALAFRVAGLDIHSQAIWFVDWPAQRLKHRLGRIAYRGIARAAIRHADVVAAISRLAMEEVKALNLRLPSKRFIVMSNLPLTFLESQVPPWNQRPRGVVYLGSLTSDHGMEYLLAAAIRFAKVGITVDIAGDGPLSADISRATAEVSGLSFHGMIHDRQELGKIMAGARVGLAIYDPNFPQFVYGDSLKIKDYLSAGLRVVTTYPFEIQEGNVLHASFDVASIVSKTLAALESEPISDPRNHELLEAAQLPLLELISALEGRNRKRSS